MAQHSLSVSHAPPPSPITPLIKNAINYFFALPPPPQKEKKNSSPSPKKLRKKPKKNPWKEREREQNPPLSLPEAWSGGKGGHSPHLDTPGSGEGGGRGTAPGGPATAGVVRFGAPRGAPRCVHSVLGGGLQAFQAPWSTWRVPRWCPGVQVCPQWPWGGLQVVSPRSPGVFLRAGDPG